MQMRHPLKIWFILVDSNGKPFHGDSETYVFLSDDPTISEFRKSVHKEYKKSDLKHVAASTLKIYLKKSDLELKEECKSGKEEKFRNVDQMMFSSFKCQISSQSQSKIQ
jgi:hypothetical protein